MGEIIRSWLQSRLGVIIDLTPEVFGHYSKDGTLLAKLLYNYDIINDTQLETITQTQDAALARVNLKHLRAWSKFIGVDFDDACLEDISNGRGTSALQVFYKLFLCLEMKDRLHFITLQKERERYIPTSTKFDVTTVSERPPPAEPVDNPLSEALVTTAEVIEWHRKKFLHAIDRYRNIEAPFCEAGEHEKMADEIIDGAKTLVQVKALEDNNDINEFIRNHSVKNARFNKKQMDIDPHAAKNYIKNLSYRKIRSSVAEEAKSLSQKDLLSSVWRKIEADQGRKLNEIIARQVLRESRYEKQMLKKLTNIRKDKDRMSNNRRLVESLMQKAKKEFLRAEEERKLQERKLDNNRIQDERKRSAELDLRIANKRLQMSEDYLQELGRQLTDDLTNIAMNCGDYRDWNYQDLPGRMWQEWKALFIQGLAVLYPEQLLLLDEELGGEGGEVAARMPGLTRREELLDRRDLEEYLQLKGLWEELLPEVDEFQALGLNILGHVVHKLLGILHPLDSRSSSPLPAYPHQVALVGLPDSSLNPFLRELLSCERIVTVRVDEVINFCLEKYKSEVKEFKFVDLELRNETHESMRTFDVDEGDEKNVHKTTQTPRLIPYEDIHPLLSDAAFIGKTIHRLLTHGKSIPEVVIPKALVAYLKSLDDIEGWVLIDYPKTYQQMVNLESELSGAPPYDLSHLKGGEEEEGEENNEQKELIKSSRLVPNPLASKNDSARNSQLTSFIKIKATSTIYEEENEVDGFYIDQGIASVFQYNFWDLETLEQLCGFIVGKVEGAGKVNVFKDLRASLESFESSHTIFRTLEERVVQPGEPAWIYSDPPQDKNLLQELGLCWINLESSYVDGLMEVLSLKRFAFLAVLPYKDFIVKYLSEFGSQEDGRQELLQQFQKAFNDIPDDMRNDDEVKYELHCRVKEFQEQLWEICARKRKNCLGKREDVVSDHWTTGQVIILINIYLALMQIELNRFVDTVDIVERYYSAIMKKDPKDRRSKPRLQRVFLSDNFAEDHKENVKLLTSPSPNLHKFDLQKEIEKILLADDRKSFEVDETIAFMKIKTNVDYCQLFVDDVLSSALEISNKSDKRSKESPPNPMKTGKKRPSKRPSKLQAKTEDPKRLEGEKKLEVVLKEWRSVLTYEATRVKTRLKVLESAWKSDADFLLTAIQHGLHLIEDKINDVYRNELRSIKEMARIFCLAVEYHKSISGEMIFDGDHFTIKLDELKDDDIFRPLEGFPAEKSDDLKFGMVQLGRLKDIFKKVAPSGRLPQRSFVFILQDLIACGEEDNKGPLVPPSWLSLDPPEVFQLVHEIFGDESHVDWREFLVYGMDLERPTQSQLLESLEHFRKKDASLCGVLPKTAFLNIPLWFHENLLNPSINSWLHEDFEYDEFQFSDKSSRYEGSRENSMRPKKKSISFRTDSVERKHLGVDEVTSEDVRLNLGKELLCEIFIDSKENVNYLKVLLAFCKDEDPRKGLAEALSVIMNCNVCGNFEDGERFLQAAFRIKEDINELRIAVLKDMQQLLDDIVDKIFYGLENINIPDMDDVSLKIDELELRRSGPISVEVLDAILDPGSLIKMADDRASLASVIESPGAPPDESYDSSDSERKISEESLKKDEITRELHYWIPMAILENFLTDLIPNITEKISIISSRRTLTQYLKDIYDETKCEELNENSEIVLAHRVINHELMSRLLESTTRFTWKNMGRVVKSIIQRRNG